MSTIPLEIVGELESGKEGKKYSATITAKGGTGKYNFSSDAPDGVKIWSELPEGLSLSSSGVLSGTIQTAGTYDIYISAKDEKRQMTFKHFKLVIE
ncbi:MAG: putative Ig domain-containing protein [Erysipelotrichales bacterium]|nr:putative Ig domain-containing protein [Erysipelotrichales bacterium]